MLLKIDEQCRAMRIGLGEADVMARWQKVMSSCLLRCQQVIYSLQECVLAGDTAAKLHRINVNLLVVCLIPAYVIMAK